MNKIFPSVSFLKKLSGVFKYELPFKVFFKDEKVNAFTDFGYDYKIVTQEKEANIIFNCDMSISYEAYHLILNNDIINISYHRAYGAFYALKTLKQILQNKEVPNIEIFDEPAIGIRGYMMDISRDKVPSLETIKKVIDLMADLKMNHLELYVEGFSYEYKSFEKYLEKDGFISVKEYLEIEEYARDRYIDLVPNQNGFGHMTKWLEKDEFKDLAVCKEGINMWGRHRAPSTLDPLNPGSLELVKKMYADMLPLYKSKYFNMNFDEPFELGHGTTEGMDVEKLYLDYTLKVYDEIKKYNKIPMIWGDVLLKHQNAIKSLPEDMIFIDWGYDANYQFSKHAKSLNERNIKFMCAPGTTSWCSFFGRYLDWVDNIRNACDAVYNYKGKGVILTDWGDFGHLQFLPVSYAPLVFMGLYSWSHLEGTNLVVRDYLNKFIFEDKNNIIGDLLLDLSNYSRYDIEYGGNGTKTFYTFMWACASINNDLKINEIDYFKGKMGSSFMPYPKFRVMRKFLNLKLEELEFVSIEKDKLVKDEIIQTIKMLKMIHKLSLAFNEEVDLTKRIRYMEEVVAAKDDFLSEQKRLWLLRNKMGGLEASLKYIECFMEFSLKTLNYLNNRGEM